MPTRRGMSLHQKKGTVTPLARSLAIALVVAACSPPVPPPATQLPTSSPTPSLLSVSPGLSPSPPMSPPPRVSPSPAPSSSTEIDVRTHAISGPLPGTVRPSGIWTGTEVILWGGWPGSAHTIGLDDATGQGAIYDPSTDSWREISESPLAPRAAHFAAWTGREMLIWGGYVKRGIATDGAAYDPVSDTWRVLAPPPSAWIAALRTGDDDLPASASAWTGSQWVIGFETDDGQVALASYDPTSDSWGQLPAAAGSDTEGIDLVWTGSDLILGTQGGLWLLRTGNETWEQFLSPPGYWRIANESAVATNGSVVVIMDARTAGQRATLAILDPASGSWRLLPAPPSPAEGTALFSDGERLLWFGSDVAYDAVQEKWLSVPIEVDREDGALVWTTDRLIQWGGWVCEGCPVYDDGVVYTPIW